VKSRLAAIENRHRSDKKETRTSRPCGTSTPIRTAATTREPTTDDRPTLKRRDDEPQQLLGASVPRVLIVGTLRRAHFNISVKKPRELAASLLKRSENVLGSGPVRQ